MVKKLTSKVNTTRRGVAPRLDHARKKAIELLTKWSEEKIQVELTPMSMGVHFLGEIWKMELGNGDGDFRFYSPFGVSSLIFLSIYDKITIEQIGDKTKIILEFKQFESYKVAISPAEINKPTSEQIEQVCIQFRLWIKLKTELMVFTGNNMHITAELCTPSEPASGKFFLSNAHSKMAHIIDPAQSEIIAFNSTDGRTDIVLFDQDTKYSISISDVQDSPERILQRFGTHSRSIQ